MFYFWNIFLHFTTCTSLQFEENQLQSSVKYYLLVQGQLMYFWVGIVKHFIFVLRSTLARGQLLDNTVIIMKWLDFMFFHFFYKKRQHCKNGCPKKIAIYFGYLVKFMKYCSVGQSILYKNYARISYLVNLELYLPFVVEQK